MRSLLAIIPIVTLLLVSCVSKKEYDALADDKSRLMRENLRLQDVEKAYQQQQQDMAGLQAALERSETNLAALRDSMLVQKQTCDELRHLYDLVVNENKALLQSSSEEKQTLTDKLAEKQSSLESREREIERMERSLQEKEIALNSMQQALSAREAKIEELNNQLNAQKESMEMLKSRIKEALLGFSDADLTVEHKNGKIYVSMSQNLLFAKDSKIIDQKGKEALKKLARVLNQNPDLSIEVEGHTDTDGTANYNWDLSVERATSVVKVLTSEGVVPERITASGRAFYDPVAPNDTEANKSKNRRTEIILSPKLDAIYELLDSAGE